MDTYQFVVILVLARLGTVLAVPALGSGVWTYFAYELMVEPLGWGLKGRFIALIGAVAVTTLYWAGGWALISTVPRMRPRARWWMLPAIGAFMLLVVGSSSWPQVQLFHAPAREAETTAHVSQASSYIDTIKHGVQKAKGLGLVLDDMAVRIDALAELELRGNLSGVASAGAVYALVRSIAADVRQVRSGVTSSGTEAEPMIGRMDATVGAMRQAAMDRKLSFEARRDAFEGHGDALRSVSIELSQKMPVMAVGALARRLQAGITTPALSPQAKVREQQMDALTRVETQLRQMGKDLEALIGPMAAMLEKGPPIYAAEAPGILIVRYWDVMLQAWTVSLSVDLFIIVLLWMACVASDEARAQENRTATRGPLAAEVHQLVGVMRELETLFRREPSPIGPHPYPLAAAARERALRAPGKAGKRPEGNHHDDEGDES